jgi:hypothetical protein
MLCLAIVTVASFEAHCAPFSIRLRWVPRRPRAGFAWPSSRIQSGGPGAAPDRNGSRGEEGGFSMGSFLTDPLVKPPILSYHLRPARAVILAFGGPL